MGNDGDLVAGQYAMRYDIHNQSIVWQFFILSLLFGAEFYNGNKDRSFARLLCFVYPDPVYNYNKFQRFQSDQVRSSFAPDKTSAERRAWSQ